jgi:hypothetical protein
MRSQTAIHSHYKAKPQTGKQKETCTVNCTGLPTDNENEPEETAVTGSRRTAEKNNM